MSPDLLEWVEPETIVSFDSEASEVVFAGPGDFQKVFPLASKTCSECGQPTEALFRSALVSDEVCESCFNRLAGQAERAIQGQCHPVGDKTPLQKQAVTVQKIAPAIKEAVK